MKTLLKAWPLSLLMIAACNTPESTATNMPDLLAAHIDSSVDPSQDFFFNTPMVNGLNKIPFRQSERSNGIFRTIQDTINDQVKRVCEESAKANAPAGSNKQKIGDFLCQRYGHAGVLKRQALLH